MHHNFFPLVCRSFDSLAEDLTRLLEDKISGAVRNIYSTAGKKVNKRKAVALARSLARSINKYNNHNFLCADFKPRRNRGRTKLCLPLQQ